jgi:hypothetical protein
MDNRFHLADERTTQLEFTAIQHKEPILINLALTDLVLQADIERLPCAPWLP